MSSCPAYQNTRALQCGGRLALLRKVEKLRQETADLKRRDATWQTERAELLLRLDNLRCVQAGPWFQSCHVVSQQDFLKAPDSCVSNVVVMVYGLHKASVDLQLRPDFDASESAELAQCGAVTGSPGITSNRKLRSRPLQRRITVPPSSGSLPSSPQSRHATPLAIALMLMPSQHLLTCAWLRSVQPLANRQL